MPITCHRTGKCTLVRGREFVVRLQTSVYSRRTEVERILLRVPFRRFYLFQRGWESPRIAKSTMVKLSLAFAAVLAASASAFAPHNAAQVKTVLSVSASAEGV